MAVFVKDIIEIVNEFAPFSLAESWDNSGLQAGHPLWPVQRIMVCLDVTQEAMIAAKEKKCDLLLSHHPLMISPEKSLDFSRMPGAAIAISASEKIAIVAAHTNLDKAGNGLNDLFARKIGLVQSVPFIVEAGQEPDTGLGRIGRMPQPLSLQSLAGQIRDRLGMAGIRVIGDLNQKISEVALCTGSGGSLISHFFASSAQVYITGDLKYHEARDIEAANRAAIDVGHFASEHIVIELFERHLVRKLESLGHHHLQIIAYTEEKDPFVII